MPSSLQGFLSSSIYKVGQNWRLPRETRLPHATCNIKCLQYLKSAKGFFLPNPLQAPCSSKPADWTELIIHSRGWKAESHRSQCCSIIQVLPCANNALDLCLLRKKVHLNLSGHHDNFNKCSFYSLVNGKNSFSEVSSLIAPPQQNQMALKLSSLIKFDMKVVYHLLKIQEPALTLLENSKQVLNMAVE